MNRSNPSPTIHHKARITLALPEIRISTPSLSNSPTLEPRIPHPAYFALLTSVRAFRKAMICFISVSVRFNLSGASV